MCVSYNLALIFVMLATIPNADNKTVNTKLTDKIPGTWRLLHEKLLDCVEKLKQSDNLTI